MEKDGACEVDRVRNEAVLERVDEERMMLKLIRKRKRNWLGDWLRRNCILKAALEGMVNGRSYRFKAESRLISKSTVLHPSTSSSSSHGHGHGHEQAEVVRYSLVRCDAVADLLAANFPPLRLLP
ncbi:hypothetical protein ANN_26633 [Periplaneta americana]|uniref:Uncharacterized protein n=1 Tax=Periplaneta americana TaxID=6978 RepID=A0ABQ8RYN3_PERAM|nr:hypothetical protein ANN_26633 [Periplaneta americana]